MSSPQRQQIVGQYRDILDLSFCRCLVIMFLFFLSCSIFAFTLIPPFVVLQYPRSFLDIPFCISLARRTSPLFNYHYLHLNYLQVLGCARIVLLLILDKPLCLADTMAPRSLIFSSLLLSPLSVWALQVTPNSPCSVACQDSDSLDTSDPNSSNTKNADITCQDVDYQNSAAGIKWKNCMTCLQNSTFAQGGENDQMWFLCK